MSVLAQTISEWELLLVDDFSTDNSNLIIRKYLSDPRIKYYKLERNMGAAAARNVGIRNSTLPYIALLDSDDVYHSEFLKLSLQSISGSADEYGFSYTGVGEIQNKDIEVPVGRVIWTLPDHFLQFNRPYLYQLQVGTAAGIMIKRKAFDKVGFFDESFQASEDTDWFIRASQFYRGLPIHKDLIFKDNEGENRLTTSYGKNASAYRFLIAKNREEIRASSFLMARWYYKSMWLNYYSGDKKAAAADYHELRTNNLHNLKISLTHLAGLALPKKMFISAHKLIAKVK